MKVSVSILSSTIKAEDIVKDLNGTNADFIHLDIMDGKFVENKTWTFSEMKKILKNTTFKFDVHLMVNNPKKYIDDYAMLNTDLIAFHIEAVKDVNEMIEYVKNYGLKVGLAINPDTKIEKLYPYLKDINRVLIMSVFPGKSGQSFIDDTLGRIKQLKEYINENNLNVEISVDGGINNETGLMCKEAGSDILVSATYLHNDLKNNINILKNL